MKHFKKKIAKLSLLAFLFLTALSTLLLSGCDVLVGIPDLFKPTYGKLEINTSDAKTVYTYQEEFDPTGLEIDLVMGSSRNGTPVDIEDCSFSGFNSLVSQMEQEITVKYGEFKGVFTVSVIITKDHILEAYAKDQGLNSSFIQEGKNIINEYSPATRAEETLFYGASNFAMWDPMEQDLMPYKVQNHAFGGSTDKDLVAYAPYLLYPYNPQYVFFQTGSNDYIYSQKPTDAEKIEEAMTYKKEMFELFHQMLPDAEFIVMAGILLPNRSQYVDMTIEINNQLEEYCNETDYMHFVDSEAMTYNVETKTFNKSLFLNDGIHLTPAARIQWANNYILPKLEELDAPRYSEEELPKNPEVEITSVALEDIAGVPTLTVKGTAFDVDSLRFRLGRSITDLYLSPIEVGADGSFTVVCDLNEFAKNNSTTLTENGYYNVTIQHNVTDTGANTNNRTLATQADIIAGEGKTVRGEKYDFKFAYWSGNVAISPSSWIYDDVAAEIKEVNGAPMLTLNGKLGNATQAKVYVGEAETTATVNSNTFSASYDLSNLTEASVYYPLSINSTAKQLSAEEVTYDENTAVKIGAKTYTFVNNNGALCVSYAVPQISDTISAKLIDKNGIPYLSVSGETTETEVTIQAGEVTVTADRDEYKYVAEINLIDAMFRIGEKITIKAKYGENEFSSLLPASTEYTADSKAIYRNNQHRNEYVFVEYNGTLAVTFSQTYTVKSLVDGADIDVVTVTDTYIGDDSYKGRIYVSGTYNVEYVSSVAGNATDGNTAKPGGASVSGLEAGCFTRYWSMMESVLNASMGRPDSNVTCNIKYTSKDTSVVETGTFQLMDARSMVAQSQISYEAQYSSSTVNDFSSSVYSYGCVKYFYYGDNGTTYVRYLTNVVEQKVYVRLNESTQKPELVLEGYLGTATKAQLHIANGTAGATPGTTPPDSSFAYSQIVTGEARSAFVMIVDISTIAKASSNSLRIYNNADGNDNLAKYYNVKPQYFTTSQTTNAPSVTYNGFIYTIANANNYLRLSVKAAA